MPKRTLLQEKNRPVHKLNPGSRSIASAWCLVDPYRRGVRTEAVNVPSHVKATCKTCLRLEWEAEIHNAAEAARKKGK